MQVSTSTGDPYDFVNLEAETLAEASRLVALTTNLFVRDKDRIKTIAIDDRLVVQIRLSKVFKHGMEVNDEHDSES